MPNVNEPKPKFYPEPRKDTDSWWDHACGCDILSDDENILQGGPGRVKKTDKWQEKDKEDAYGN
jgi:hypothetical protein